MKEIEEVLNKPKSNRGGPTKYRPEMCEIVVREGVQGASIAEMAKACGVAISKIYAYSDRYPEFKEAFRSARDLSIAWLWECGRSNLKNRNFRESTFQYILNAKHGLGNDAGFMLPKNMEKMTLIEKTEVMMRRFECGKISSEELKNAFAAFASKANIEEKAELKPLLEEIKSKMPDMT